MNIRGLSLLCLPCILAGAPEVREEILVVVNGHVITRIAQWERRDWGAGGSDFHWWCTDTPDAFVGRSRVVDSMRDELIAMIGEDVYQRLLAYIDHRRGQPSSTRVAHPVVRRRR